MGFLSLVFLWLLSSAYSQTEEALLQAAAAQYEQAYQAGLVSSAIRFERYPAFPPQESPASAMPDFQQQVCTIYLAEEPLRELGLDRGGRFRFVVFHEMAHCDLFFSAARAMRTDELPPIANRMLSDLIKIEYLFPDLPRRPNGYLSYQETYADIKALALRLMEGASDEEVKSILQLRRNGLTAVNGSHGTAGILEQVAAEHWHGLPPAAIDQKARALADRHIANTFIERAFLPSSTPFLTSRLLEGGLQTICSSLKSHWALPEEAALLKQHLGRVASSPKKIWQDVAELVNRSPSCEQFVSDLFQRRYGKGVDELAEQDAAISAHLQKMRSPARRFSRDSAPPANTFPR